MCRREGRPVPALKPQKHARKRPEGRFGRESPAELAPARTGDRRSRPPARQRAWVGPVTLATEWLLLILWMVGPAASEWHHRLQPLVWVPDWVWLGAIAPLGLAGLLAAIARSGSIAVRSARAVLAILPIALVADGVLERDWRPLGPSPRDDASRLVFVNANHPPQEKAAEVVDSILALDPEVVVVTNPGWLASAWRTRAASEVAGTPWRVRWVNPVMVATRGGGASLRTVVRAGEVAAVWARFDAGTTDRLGVEEILVVDLPSDQTVDRGGLVDELAESIEQDARSSGRRPRLVLGDLNLTPRTPALDRLVPGMKDVFSRYGAGWSATWPRTLPVVRIDFVLAAEDVPVRGVRTFDPGAGNHRGIVIELQPQGGVDAGGAIGKP